MKGLLTLQMLSLCIYGGVSQAYTYQITLCQDQVLLFEFDRDLPGKTEIWARSEKEDPPSPLLHALAGDENIYTITKSGKTLRLGIAQCDPEAVRNRVKRILEAMLNASEKNGKNSVACPLAAKP